MRIEDKLKEEIIKKGYSIKSFSEKIDVPYTTVRGALQNGINKSSVDTVIKIAEGLDLSVDALGEGKILPNINTALKKYSQAFIDNSGFECTGLENLNNSKLSICHLLEKSALEENLGKDLIDIYYEEMYRIFGKTKASLIEENETRYKTEKSEYPYVPQSVSAGVPLAIEGFKELPHISLPKALFGKYANRGDIVIMAVNGDSMDKIIPDKSHIGLITNIALADLRDGDIVVFNYEGNYSLKHYYNINDKEVLFRPNSSNIKHRDIIMKKDNSLDITGKVIMYNVVLD